MKTVVCQRWEESERGWGVRPDGCSLHLSETDRLAFCKEFWARERKNNIGGQTPEEYSRESGRAILLDVDDLTYALVSKSNNGIWLLESEFRELLKEMKPR